MLNYPSKSRSVLQNSSWTAFRKARQTLQRPPISWPGQRDWRKDWVPWPRPSGDGSVKIFRGWFSGSELAFLEIEVAIEPDKTVVFGSWNPWLFGRHLSANCLWNMSHSMSVTDNYSTTHFGGVENFDPYTVFRNRSLYFSEAHGPAACTPLQKWTVSWSSEMTLATLKEFCTQTYAFWPSLPACRRFFLKLFF